MADCDVVLVFPVLGRPGHALEAVENASGAMTGGARYRVLFVCNPNDKAQLAACRETGADVLVTTWKSPARGDWARKLNLALRETDEPWLFTGADDLCFCPGWCDRALEVGNAIGAGVVGTNDLGNGRVIAGLHSTHSLVARWYAERHGTIDQPGLVAHEGYSHNYADDELVHTARARHAFVFAAASHVEHLHPNWGKGSWDATYQLGRDRMDEDGHLFEARRMLWETHRVDRAVAPHLDRSGH